MSAEARIASTWKKQKFFVGLMLIAFGGWFFFDGAIGYPLANNRYRVWKKFHDANQENEWMAFADQEGWKRNEWNQFLADHHLTAKPPEVAYGSEKISGQFLFGSLTAGLGVIILVYWLTQIGRVLRTDEEAVYTPAGVRVPFGSITGVGKKKWDSKGIATVRYELDGQRSQFIVDDYKFEAEPTRKILAEIEEKLIAGTPEA
jgi:hypothetical protein